MTFETYHNPEALKSTTDSSVVEANDKLTGVLGAPIAPDANNVNGGVKKINGGLVQGFESTKGSHGNSFDVSEGKTALNAAEDYREAVKRDEALRNEATNIMDQIGADQLELEGPEQLDITTLAQTTAGEFNGYAAEIEGSNQSTNTRVMSLWG